LCWALIRRWRARPGLTAPNHVDRPARVVGQYRLVSATRYVVGVADDYTPMMSEERAKLLRVWHDRAYDVWSGLGTSTGEAGSSCYAGQAPPIRTWQRPAPGLVVRGTETVWSRAGGAPSPRARFEGAVLACQTKSGQATARLRFRPAWVRP
jgi:hypothetical protein